MQYRYLGAKEWKKSQKLNILAQKEMLAPNHGYTDLTKAVVITMAIMSWLCSWSSPWPYWVNYNEDLIFMNFSEDGHTPFTIAMHGISWEVHHGCDSRDASVT